MADISVLVLVGLPGTGKTTLSKNLGVECGTYNFIHIEFDRLIPWNKAFKNNGEWKAARKAVLLLIEQLLIYLIKRNVVCPEPFQCSVNNLREPTGKVILIIDDNMFYKSMRYCVYQMAKKYNLGYSQIYITCSVEEALKINSTRAKEKLPPSCIIEMEKKIEIPQPTNSWESLTLKLKPHSDFVKIKPVIYDLLEESLKCPVKSDPVLTDTSQSKIICSENLTHQIDIYTRSIIGLKIKEKKICGANVKDFAISLNRKRTELLNGIKSGDIQFSNLEKTSSLDQELKDYLTSYFD